MHRIVATIEDDVEKPSNVFSLSLSQMGIHLRSSISLASRVSEIGKSDIPKLQSEYKQYFNLASLFHSTNLSVWTVGHAVPFHTTQLLEDLGVGLGINSMQG